MNETRVLRWATVLHGLTGQEIEDIENATGRPLSASDLVNPNALTNLRGRNAYMSTKSETTRPGFLLASSE